MVGEIARKMPAVDARLQSGIVVRARSLDVGLVITSESLLEETVERLRRDDRMVALWFPDTIANLGRGQMFGAPYTALFFKLPQLVERIRRLLGINAFFLPEACNPRWHRPPPNGGRKAAVVVAGNMHPYRLRLMERLAGEGIPLEFYGPPWPRWLHSPSLEPFIAGRYLRRQEKAAVFREAAVVLNTLHPSEVESCNARLFEAAGCGASIVTEEGPALRDFFVPGEEVVTYGGFEELVERCRWLLEDLGSGRRIGDAASKRAHRDHTYDIRLKEMLGILGVGDARR